MSIGASGVPVQVHGIGSASRDLAGMTPELYLRWLAMGVFSANFSFQGVNGLMPWDFGDEVLAHVRTWMQWRYRLVPYVLGAIEDSARTGLPVQRSMALSFPTTSMPTIGICNTCWARPCWWRRSPSPARACGCTCPRATPGGT